MQLDKLISTLLNIKNNRKTSNLDVQIDKDNKDSLIVYEVRNGEDDLSDSFSIAKYEGDRTITTIMSKEE